MPVATDDVVISTTATTQPVISTTAVAKSVEVRSGASLSISSAGRLTINGFAILDIYGGVMLNDGSNGGESSPHLTNCSFLTNSATSSGGAIFNYGYQGESSPQPTNCSFQTNSANNGGAMVNYGVNGKSSPLLTNCVVWGGSNIFFLNNASPITARYSLFDASVNPTHYTATDPTNLTATTSPFASITSVALAACSPAINAGNSISYTAATSLTVDLASNPRLVGSSIDMGAVEYQTTPNYPVAFTLSPVSGSVVCAGSSVSVAVSVSGTGPYSYQWFKNGTAVASQTAATLSLPTATTADAGSYSVVVTGACNSVTSTAFSLTVSALTSAIVTAIRNAGLPSTTLTCADPSLMLTVQPTATTYVWNNNSTSQTLPISQTGVYSVTVTDVYGCTAISNSLSITQDLSLPSFAVSSVSVCQGQHVNLLASGCPGGTVVWSTGTTGTTLTLTAGSSTSMLTATCTIGSCSTSASGSVVIGGLQPPPAQILSLRADESACPVRLVGQGVGTLFVFTNASGYVFSNVYRNGGVHELIGLDVKKPGVYTLKATYSNVCGSSATVSQTVTVNRSCP